MYEWYEGGFKNGRKERKRFIDNFLVYVLRACVLHMCLILILKFNQGKLIRIIRCMNN